MDGDAADVDALVELCAQEHALLVLDEAHAVLGPDVDAPARRRRAARRHAVEDARRARRLRRRSDAATSSSSRTARRPYIFTTAPTPADTAAALAALAVVRSTEGDALVARLRAHVDRVRPGHPSPIVPFVCGEEQRALAAAAALLEHGLLVPAIRPPTVAPGTSRLAGRAVRRAHRRAGRPTPRGARRGVRRRARAAHATRA